MKFYFLPRAEVLSCEQIQGLIGIDPRHTDEEVLNFTGIYRVVELSREQDPFLSPESVYEIREGVAYERESSLPLPLTEAKEKARQYLLEQSRGFVRSSVECSGFPPEFLLLESLVNSNLLKSLRESIEKEALSVEKKLESVENASNVNELRRICYGG